MVHCLSGQRPFHSESQEILWIKIRLEISITPCASRYAETISVAVTETSTDPPPHSQTM